MKKIKNFFRIFVAMVLIAGMAHSLTLDGTTNLELYCYNATDGQLLGASATITCKNNTLTTEINGASLTNVATGKFNYTFSLSEGTYSCIMDCPADCLDSSFYIYSRSSPVSSCADNTTLTEAATNISEILKDTNELQANQSSFVTATGFQTASIAAAMHANVSNNFTVLTQHGDINWTPPTDYSTHSAADVWTAGSRALSTPADYKADVTNLDMKVSEVNASVYSYFTSGTNENAFKATGFSTHNESDVWIYDTRELTYYPSTTAIISLDFSASGLINSTFYDVGRGHILGTTTPDNDGSFASNYYKRYNFDIGAVPDNVTGAWLIIWFKKVGSPVGNITVDVEGDLINRTDVTQLTTDYQQFKIWIGPKNISDGYIEININGSAGFSVPNNVHIGAGASSATVSEESSGGVTWEHPSYEYAIGLVIEYNQKSMADLVNEKSINLHKTYPVSICPTQTIVSTFVAKDYQGNALDILKLPECKIVEIFDSGKSKKNTSMTNNLDVTESDTHKVKVSINGTYTENMSWGKHFKMSCNATVVAFKDGSNVTLSPLGFPFTMGTESQCKFWNDTLQGNFTTVVTTGNSAWKSATGFASLQNGTDILAAIGVFNYYDQSIADMIGYNISDGNIETDLDSAGGTTPAAVWGYVARTTTAGNITNVTGAVTLNELVEGIGNEINSSHGEGLYNSSEVTIDNHAIAQAVMDINISGMQFNNTIHTMYEILITGGFSAFAQDYLADAFRYCNLYVRLLDEGSVFITNKP